jgi:hypothetical protein
MMATVMMKVMVKNEVIMALLGSLCRSVAGSCESALAEESGTVSSEGLRLTISADMTIMTNRMTPT